MSQLPNSEDPRPLIGTTVANRPDRAGRPRLAVNRAYVTALQAAGADVVLLPPGPNGPPSSLFDRLDGLLLPGGVDVGPLWYGERPRPGLGDVDEDLDALELPLARAAVERRLPVLGICRGQHVVNVALGGTLYQDLARDGGTDFPHATPQERGRDFLAHRIEVTPTSHLRRALGGGRLEVNSFHHQAVRRVAPGLLVAAVSPDDGIVEGMESPDGLVLTVQCHPEELTAHGWACGLFRSFVLLAAERSLHALRA
ncbi:MAG TPA: gamma-glutamyl-gamma-aminobutyrate hydrolase family protein [Candidatus Eisenbacteria bacterium]|nr:gamma-glutamyl-gamma-aminobutyrate hydrolase family protein [Candidatus Eisenbacteria bacterium]